MNKIGRSAPRPAAVTWSRDVPPLQSPAARKWRLNTRSLVALSVLLAIGLAGGGIAWYVQKVRGQSTMVKQARALADSGKDDLAVSYLNRYLASKPQDLDALALKAELLTRSREPPSTWTR